MHDVIIDKEQNPRGHAHLDPRARAECSDKEGHEDYFASRRK